MARLFTELKDVTEPDSYAEYGIVLSGDKTYHILLGQNYSFSSLCFLHGQIQNASSNNPNKWLFLIEENSFYLSPEADYGYYLAEVQNIPSKNPIIHSYDRVAIRKAVNEGFKESDVYLAVALQSINKLPHTIELRDQISDRIESLSYLWGVKEDALLKLIANSGDDRNEKRFVRMNKKINLISDRMDEIAHTLTVNGLKRTMHNYSGKKEIFVNIEPENLCLLNEIGIDTKSLFKGSEYVD